MATKKQIIIKAEKLFDGFSYSKNKFVIIEGSQIVDVCSGNLKPDFEGIVTPAFIDPHSHIGMMRAGEHPAEEEANDHIDQIAPLTNPINSIYFDDSNFAEAVDFGILYSCIIPGSGNLFGGQAKVIRNFARNVDECLVHDYGFKMALGYNPRASTGWRGLRPNTRMGSYALLEKRFDEVLRKKGQADLKLAEKKVKLAKELSDGTLNNIQHKQQLEWAVEENILALEVEDQQILLLLQGKKPVKVHVHKEDDVIYLLQLIDKYKIKVSFEHTCDVHNKRIFDLIADSGSQCVFGPVGSFAYKTELKHDSYKNLKVLMDSKLDYGLMTDHPVIAVSSLRDSLKFFLIQGMTEEAALALITSKNAKMINVDSFLGSIKPSMWASLLVWNKDPLHLSALPQTVIAEGKVLRK